MQHPSLGGLFNALSISLMYPIICAKLTKYYVYNHYDKIMIAKMVFYDIFCNYEWAGKSWEIPKTRLSAAGSGDPCFAGGMRLWTFFGFSRTFRSFRGSNPRPVL